MITVVLVAQHGAHEKIGAHIKQRISQVCSGLVYVLPGGYATDEITAEVRAPQLNGNAELVELVGEAAFNGIKDSIDVSAGIVCRVDGYPDLTKIRPRYIGLHG